jgi:hypothetical protein
MTNEERDHMLIKISNKIYNGLGSQMEAVEKHVVNVESQVAGIRRKLWALLCGIVLLCIGVGVDVVMHLV